MPLKPGKSQDVIAQNALEMQKAGHGQSESWAAAYNNAGEYKPKKKSRNPQAGIKPKPRRTNKPPEQEPDQENQNSTGY